MSVPSGLPAGLPPGYAVAIGPGIGGQATAYLAYANPTSGLAYRKRFIGLTLERAPEEEGQPVLIQTIGSAPYVNVESVAYRSGGGVDAFGNGPGESVPPPPDGHGKAAYLQDGDPSNEFTQGLLGSTPSSTKRIAVGFYLSHKQVLLMPRLVTD